MLDSTSRRKLNVFFGSAMLIAVGCILLLGAAGIEIFSEMEAHRNASTLQEGSAQVRSVESKKINGANEGKLVCVKDKVIASGQVCDDDFAIALNAVKLQRNVSKYQWEERDKDDHSMDREYVRDWSDKLVDSHKFIQEPGHHNPTSYRFPPGTVYAKNVSLGAFKLSPEVIDSMPAKPLAIAKTTNVAVLPASKKHKITVEEEHFYCGKDPSVPDTGDERISYEQILPCEYTIVAKQQGDRLVPFETKVGNTIALSKPALLSAQEMFKSAKDENEQNIQRGRMFAVAGAVFGLLFLTGGVFSLIWAKRNPDKAAPVVKRGQIALLVVMGAVFLLMGIFAIGTMGWIALPVVIAGGCGYALVATLFIIRNRQ